MKKRKILIGVAIGASVAAVIVIHRIRKERLKKKLARVAEEGYETAPDILYPGLNFSRNKYHS